MANPNEPEPVKAQLVITVTGTNQLRVDGPIENVILCYGMLETAKDVIREQQRLEKRQVQPAPSGLVLPGIRG